MARQPQSSIRPSVLTVSHLVRDVLTQRKSPPTTLSSRGARGDFFSPRPHALLFVRQPGAFAVYHIIRPLAISTPIAGTTGVGEFAPGLWSYPFLGLPDDVKLPVFLDLANIHALPGVMVLFIDFILANRAVQLQPFKGL